MTDGQTDGRTLGEDRAYAASRGNKAKAELVTVLLLLLLLLFFTLGIKDPEGFGKKLEENVSE